MTTGKFCDLHKDSANSLIRPQKGQHIYTLKLEYDETEIDKKTGKKTRWIVESAPLNACHIDAMELIVKRAQGLGVDLGWKKYRIIKDANTGKFSRIYADEEVPDEVES